jgi:hypothetical protein
MRIHFRAKNPGVCLFHCHTESHLDRGIGIMIHVRQNWISIKQFQLYKVNEHFSDDKFSFFL